MPDIKRNAMAKKENKGSLLTNEELEKELARKGQERIGMWACRIPATVRCGPWAAKCSAGMAWHPKT